MDSISNSSTGEMATNSSTNGTADGEPTVKFIVIVSFGTLVGVWNIVSNIIIIIATFRRIKLKTRTGYFIVSLAAADLLNGVCNLTAGYLREYVPQNYDNPFICGAYVMIQVFPFVVSLASLTCMALDRYLAVVKPLKSRTLLTKSRSVWIIILSWIGSLAVSTPTIFCNRDSQGEACSLRHMHKYYFLYVFQVFFWVLVLSKLYMYAAVVYSLQKNLRGFKTGQQRRLTESRDNVLSERKLSAEVRLTKLVFLVLVLFLISWLPMVIVLNFYFLGYNDLRKFVGYVAILTYCHSGVNLILYLTRSRDYRRACKQLFCAHCTNVNQESSILESSDTQRSQERAMNSTR